MLNPTALVATVSGTASPLGGQATALAMQSGVLADLASLRQDRAAMEATGFDRAAQSDRIKSQTDAGKRASAYATARLEHLQKALHRLLGGAWSGPAVIAVASQSGADAVSTEATVVDAIATGDGADAVTIRANTASSIHTDDDGGNFGQTRYFANPDAVAIAARHVYGVHTGGGDDAIAVTAGDVQGVHAGDGADRVAITATLAGDIHGEGGDDAITLTIETGMLREVEPETDEGRMMRARYAAGVYGGAGDDRIAVNAADAYAIAGGVGNDNITATGGTFALHIAAGDGQDVVDLRDGAEAVVMLDASLTDGWTMERGADSLTLRFGQGQSITFTGLQSAGAIGVSRTHRDSVTLLHSPPGLDLRA